MATKALNGVLTHLRKLAAVQTKRGLSDHELLERFVARNDEAAFTALIERHGPVVLGVCRRALGNVHDAEDACQATFLVLARKAARIRQRTSLSGWLHGVACRVSADVKRQEARRLRRQRFVQAPAPKDAGAEVTWREVQTILDEELERLAERYRTPLILCYLDGKTRDEAAGQLGVSPGTLHGRLERGRRLLHERLTQRGLTLSAALFATALSASGVQAALPPTLVVASTKAAMLSAAGQPLHGLVAARVLTLTQGVLKTMFLTKLKLGTTAALGAGLLAVLVSGSLTSTGLAQDGFYPPAQALILRGANVQGAKAETDEDFIRRMSKDLRGSEPTPAEVHFFVASKDAGKRDKLIDLFIQERQAKKEAEARSTAKRVDRLIEMEHTRYRQGSRVAAADIWKSQLTREEYSRWLTRLAPPRLDALQSKFYKDLFAAKEKGDVAKITQTYLDRLAEYAKSNPKSDDTPDAMLQIIRVYESQGKTVEAGAWREKLLKEHPTSSAAKAVK